ncbi:mannitol-1-phosphate 5-dehydrogenase [Candidatus Uhrbacteria bacterium]|nr:mannitol-1-phosphate 5-dehydrogenase [Candidatus Uhrbacteria bacterium]
MKAVHFGAGNIGRGFIGLLLCRSGYDVTFVDVNAEVVRLLNALGRYPVCIVGDTHGMHREWVDGVKALHVEDRQSVAEAIAEADVVTTAVGKSALVHIAPLILDGMRLRRHDTVPVIVVACENVLGNSSYLADLVRQIAPLDASSWLRAAVFPDCVVDRIVPNAAQEAEGHPLAVTVEEYCQWAIDSSHLQILPLIDGAEFREGLESVLAQKLFTLNMAHAIVGYYGYLRERMFIHQAMQDETIRVLLEGALSEVSRVIVASYGISATEQAQYAAKVIQRLENPALADTVIRVGREPKRKLGSNDRLVAPALKAIELGHIPAHLATGVAAALAFDCSEDRDAQALQVMVAELGLKEALHRVSGVEHDHALAQLIHATALYRQL